jgi:hypothetical protein
VYKKAYQRVLRGFLVYLKKDVSHPESTNGSKGIFDLGYKGIDGNFPEINVETSSS